MALLDRLLAPFAPPRGIAAGVPAGRTGRRQAGLPAAVPRRAGRHRRGGIPRRPLLPGRHPACRPAGPKARAGSNAPPTRATSRRRRCWRRCAMHGLVAPCGRRSGEAAANLFDGNTRRREPDFESRPRNGRASAAEGGSADGQAVLGYILTSGPETHARPGRGASAGTSARRPPAVRKVPSAYALSLARDCQGRGQQAKVAEHLRQAADAGLADRALPARAW